MLWEILGFSSEEYFESKKIAQIPLLRPTAVTALLDVEQKTWWKTRIPDLQVTEPLQQGEAKSNRLIV